MERKNKPNNGLTSDAVNAVMLGLDECAEADAVFDGSASAATSSTSSAKPQPVTEFSALSPEQVFSCNSYYKLYNRDTKREFIINGLVLESRVGLDSALRDKLLSRSVQSFRVDNAVAKFYCYKL